LPHNRSDTSVSTFARQQRPSSAGDNEQTIETLYTIKEILKRFVIKEDIKDLRQSVIMGIKEELENNGGGRQVSISGGTKNRFGIPKFGVYGDKPSKTSIIIAKE
jgi:hypothetical protein